LFEDFGKVVRSSNRKKRDSKEIAKLPEDEAESEELTASRHAMTLAYISELIIALV